MLPEQAAALSALGAPRYSMFLLIDTTEGPVRAWTGVGDYEVAPDEVDTEGGTYLGIGLVGEIPALRQLIGGVAERVEFSLSGADETAVSLADDSADQVRGARVNVGIVFFDENWQSPTGPAWLWEGTADVPTVERDGSGGTIIRRVSLSVASTYTDRTRPRLSFYTDSDQRQRSATDTFCVRTGLYSVESTIKWPD